MNDDKLTILVDLDSITANLMEKWLGDYNSDYDDNLTVDDAVTWNLGSYVKCGEKIYSYLTPELFRSLNPIKGAIPALKRLVVAGHEVVFVTASPDNCRDAKVAWVREHCPFVSEVIATHKKYLIHGDVFIDDSPANILSYRKRHPNANIFTIAYPYNAEVEKHCDLMLGSWRDTETAWEGFVEAIEEISFNRSTTCSLEGQNV